MFNKHHLKTNRNKRMSYEIGTKVNLLFSPYFVYHVLFIQLRAYLYVFTCHQYVPSFGVPKARRVNPVSSVQTFAFPSREVL